MTLCGVACNLANRIFLQDAGGDNGKLKCCYTRHALEAAMSFGYWGTCVADAKARIHVLDLAILQDKLPTRDGHAPSTNGYYNDAMPRMLTGPN